MPHDPQEFWRNFLANPDQAHFQPVFEASRALVWTLCYRILMNEEDAGDAFQAAYARLLSVVKSRPLDEALKSNSKQFLYRLAVREAGNLRMRQKRRAQREVAMDPLPNQAAVVAGADRLAAQKELRGHLEALMRLLPDDYRLPLQLHYFDGLTQGEIADALETNQGTISRRMTKGIKQLEPLARRAGLGDVLGGLGIVTLGAALLQPPAAFSAAVVFAQANAALAAGTGIAGGMFASSSTGLKAAILATAKVKMAAAIASAAFVVGVGTIMTLGAINKSHAPVPTAVSVGNSVQEEKSESSKPAMGGGAVASSVAESMQQVKNSTADALNTLAGISEKAKEKLIADNSVSQPVSSPVAANAPAANPQSPAANMSQQVWRLADGNPILLEKNDALICVVGAERTDGKVGLIYLAAKLPESLKFVGYDSEGTAHEFVAVKSKTQTQSQTQGGEQLGMHEYKLAAESGNQIVSIGMTANSDESGIAEKDNSMPGRFKRAQQDLRLITTALESYFVDNNAYPVSTQDVEGSIHFAVASRLGNTNSWKWPSFRIWKSEAEKFMTLTTPVSYIQSYPDDAFFDQPGRTYQYFANGGGWLLWSPGPDGNFDINWADYCADNPAATLEALLPKTYDPTNGTSSGGDVWRIKQ